MEENQVSPTGNSPESVEPIPPTEPHSSFESENLAPEPESPVPEQGNISPEPVSPDPAQTFEANNFPEPAPKKKKTGLLLFIVIVVLLITGVIVAILFLTKKPEQDVKAASTKFLDTLTAILTSEATDVENKNLKIDGNIKITPKDNTVSLPSYFSGSDLSIDFSLEANDNANAQATIKTDSFASPLKADLKELNKTLYFKIEGIKDFGSIFSSIVPSTNVASSIIPLLSESDQVWYEFNLNEDIEKLQKASEDILQSETSTIESPQTQESIKVMRDFLDVAGIDVDGLRCAESEAKTIATDFYIQIFDDLTKNGKISELISFSPDESRKYNEGETFIVEFNAEKITNLINTYMADLDEKLSNAYTTCGIGNMYYGSSEMKVEDIKNALDRLPNIYVSVNNQEIQRIFVEYSYYSVNFSITLDISYPDSISIDAPENAESFVELYKNLYKKLIEEALGPLQTNLQDTSIRDGVLAASIALTSYMSNNGGKMPEEYTEWNKWWDSYIGEQDYSLGKICSYTEDGINDCATPDMLLYANNKDQVFIAKNASCGEGNKSLVYEGNTRSFAVYAITESEEIVCENN